jgi:thioesterase domain-containing protein/acyl carrier protein
VWADVLGLKEISVTRSFFAYGGHSLKAAVVVRRLSDQLGIDVALSALMVARTVRELSRTIDARLGGSPPPAHHGGLLLPLTSKTSPHPEVIFLPGIGGHVFTFAPIADKMTSSGVGLRTFGSEPGETPFGSVEALATHNLAALDDAGVHDDVVFAGYSFGGLVAYEMALQRSAQGRPPRHLVIFDTMAPGYPKKLPAWTRARLHAETLAERDWGGRVDYLKQRFENLKETLNHRLQRADAFADAFALNADELAALPPAQRGQLERLAGVSTVAHHGYWPRSSTSVPLLLFAAEHRLMWDATRNDDPLLGWGAWISGAVERVELGGDHLRLFQSENLGLAATTIDQLVARYR